MKISPKRCLALGIAHLAAFAAFTLALTAVDVQPAGESGTDVGFAAVNLWFHKLTGVHMWLYTVTDFMGLVPVAVCILFAGIGALQLIKRKSLFRVDRDILFLGAYYGAVIAAYVLFECLPLNYRPVLINGRQEASYPSSTTLLTLSVMPTIVFFLNPRLKSPRLRRAVTVFAVAFSAVTVAGRLVSGVHWLTDIVGGLLLSGGAVYFSKAIAIES